MYAWTERARMSGEECARGTGGGGGVLRKSTVSKEATSFGRGSAAGGKERQRLRTGGRVGKKDRSPLLPGGRNHLRAAERKISTSARGKRRPRRPRNVRDGEIHISKKY